MRPALEVLRRRLPGHWESAKAESVLGAILAGLAGARRSEGRFEEASELFAEAEALVLESYPHIRDDRGPDHYRTREAMERIIFLFETWGRPQKAVEWQKRLSD